MKQLCTLFAALALCCSCAPRTDVSSPDGRIVLGFALDESGRMNYTVAVDGEPVFLTSPLGLEAAHENLAQGFEIEGVDRASVDQTWTQPWGENKTLRDNHNEMAVRMRNGDGVGLTLRFRVFDDGYGFRYEYAVPIDSLSVTEELTTFRFAQDGDSWTIPSHFDTYELLYRKLPLGELSDANTPATFKVGGLYGSIHEAALYDFPEMNLRRNDSLTFTAALAPLPDGTKARVGGVFQTPWRTVQLAPDAVGLINSALILNLNEPSKIADTSWIRPMKYVGVWWGMHLGTETWTMGPHHGATTANAKRYIDFAAANNIQGVLFEGWNKGWDTWGGKQSFDYAGPYEDFDMTEIVRYARAKGVEVISHHETGANVPEYERLMEPAFKWLSELGVHNLKTGYAGGMPGYLHHSQYGVNHYQKVVETAAKYRVTINAHEPIKETGIRRTWPNMMSREGARGKEWDAWSTGNPPSHEVMLPFTRLLAGPMDFTPGTFDVLYENTRDLPHRKLWNCGPEVKMRTNSTLAKQVASWVILYSPVQMASDLIENYEGHPAFQFFRDFNADCDWSKALAGEPGEFVAIVRRAGEEYFLGASTDEQGRTLNLALDFLNPDVRYTATIYADAADADWIANPTAYAITQREVTAADVLEVRMAPGGGQAVSFRPI